MLKPITFFYILLFGFLTVSCKNEAQDNKNLDVPNSANETTQTPLKRAPKKDLTPEDIAMLKSVMSRVMSDAQLKKFASYVVTAELANQLSNDEGPFTIFAPSNQAIELLTAERKKFYADPENKSKLDELLKSHIVVGNLDREALLQNIKENGKAKLKTLAGNTLTASKSGEAILITDGKKGSATVINNGTEASNGIVYVIDSVLNAN